MYLYGNLNLLLSSNIDIGFSGNYLQKALNDILTCLTFMKMSNATCFTVFWSLFKLHHEGGILCSLIRYQLAVIQPLAKKKKRTPEKDWGYLTQKNRAVSTECQK